MSDIINIGDHVTLVFQAVDPANATTGETIERSALVTSAPDPAKQQAEQEAEDSDNPYHPVLTVISVSQDSSYTDRYGVRPERFSLVKHKDNWEADNTGSAGPLPPYWQ